MPVGQRERPPGPQEDRVARPKGPRKGHPSQEQVDRALARLRDVRDRGHAARAPDTRTGSTRTHPDTALDPESLFAQWLETDEAKRPGRDEFITFSSDDRGQQVSMKVNVSPGIATIMSQIVEQGVVPAYRTRQDIVRDALVHRLWDIVDGATLDGAAIEMLHAETIDTDLRTAVERVERGKAVVSQARDALKALQGEPGFWTVLEKVRAKALGMGEPYRRQLLEIVAQYEARDAT